MNEISFVNSMTSDTRVAGRDWSAVINARFKQLQNIETLN